MNWTEINAASMCIALGGAALNTFFRGFQNKTVAAGAKKTAFFNGILMEAMDLVVIASLVHSPSVFVILAAALGSGVGWVSGMTVHDLLTAKKRKQEAKEAKKELKATVDKRIDKAFDRINEACAPGTDTDPRVPVGLPDGTVVHLRESLYNAIKAESLKAQPLKAAA